MPKRTNILPRGEADRLTRFVTGLVTGNSITEDISPIAKGKDPIRAARSSAKREKLVAEKAARSANSRSGK